MLARSARSPLARSSPFGRLPPPFARSARSRQRLCLPWLCYARPPCRRSTSARSSARSARSFSVSLRKGKRYFREKRAFRGTHVFPENGIFGFCSASAPQKQDLQKSTLHNTQLCDIFYPSAFGYGKCHITCVMYKPLRLWLRGSTFLQKLRPTAFAGVRSPLGRSDRPSFARATSAPTLRPTAFAGVRSPLSRLRPTAFAGVRPAAGSAAGRLTAPPPPPSAGSLWSALPPSAPWVVFILRSAPNML